LIERDQEKPHSLNAAELVAALAPKLRQHPWRASHLLNQLEEQRYSLVEFALATEDAALECIETI
jgi:hypothetical protein